MRLKFWWRTTPTALKPLCSPIILWRIRAGRAGLAREKGIGTIAMKPLAGGNLDDWELALRYIAASGVIDIMIPGMGSPEEVDRNASVNLAAPLTAEELSRCDAVRKELGTSSAAGAATAPPAPTALTFPPTF